MFETLFQLVSSKGTESSSESSGVSKEEKEQKSKYTNDTRNRTRDEEYSKIRINHNHAR